MEAPSTETARASNRDLTDRIEALRARLRELRSVVVCFSGGIDSAFLVAVASRELADRALALTAVGPALPQRERAEAARLAEELGARHRLVASNELARAGYVANGPDRCFHCKSELYAIAEQVRQEEGAQYVLNGTNVDDLGDYRPGLEAAKNAGALSPLVELGFTKADVRAAARLIGLRLWNKPASACLSSRIPYGTEVTTARLAMVERFEDALRNLGFSQLRVRHHETVARIEVPESELPRLLEGSVRAAVTTAGKAAGYTYVTLDLDGYRVGSTNETLIGRRLTVVS